MRLEHLLVRQAGVLTTAQAVDAGVSARTVRRRVQQREWEVLHPGVYLVAGYRLTDEARVRAAWLWAGESALVSGPAAAFWFRMLDHAPPEIEVTVPRHRHLRPQPGVVLRRRDIAPVDRVEDRHLRLTAEALTALETAVAQPRGSVFLDRALQRHVRFPTLYRAYCRNMGRHGSSRAGQLITASADRADSSDSW
jgi:Transcriptional regulator, AbiEi antitoxin